MSEFAFHRQVAEFLDLVLAPPDWWTTFPSGGGGRARGGKLKSMGLKAGVPDILILTRRKVLWLELKTKTGRVAPEQKAMKHTLECAGCEVWVARSLDDVATALRQAGIATRGEIAA